MKRRKNTKKQKPLNRFAPRTIQSTILISFTVLSIVLMVFLSGTLFSIFANNTKENVIEADSKLADQAAVNLDNYLTNMRRVSDAIYYDALKDMDLDVDSVDDEMKLMYESNKDNLVSIALFSETGELISASPLSTVKNNVDVTQQEWFQSAIGEVENQHFSTPHVQNIFVDKTYQYHWVISLSQEVDLTRNGVPEQAVLLVEMNYATINQMMNRLNDSQNGQYFYLCSADGDIIYHPRQMQIEYGLSEENNIVDAHLQEGVSTDTLNGTSRSIIVSSISYTGWKLVGVVTDSSLQMSVGRLQYIVIMIVAIALIILVVLNRLISIRITKPIKDLTNSLSSLDEGSFNEDDIYVGGSEEIQQLGMTTRRSMRTMNSLMQGIVKDEEDKRKNEMDALQAQINPHFLYNTLDSIVWMIEANRNKDAEFMVTQLAQLFRVSLSKGNNIIPIEQELKHANSYLNIQKVRYKDSFAVKMELDPEADKYCTVKLVLQPLIENAIYYGVEGMDGDGVITIRSEKKGSDIYLSVIDNGFGMPQEQVDDLLKPEKKQVKKKKHGSGVGLVNVNERIRLRFGPGYGLTVKSELDEGTDITIHIPAVLYTEDNQKMLENGTMPSEVTK
jgi:two-component system sensor histidine kinase YesM